MNGMLLTRPVHEVKVNAAEHARFYAEARREDEARAARLEELRALLARGAYRPDLQQVAARLLVDASF